MPKKHVETVCNELRKLAKERKKIFSVLHDQKRYGWEKWLQVELAFRLSAFGDPEFEVMHKYNQLYRKPKSKANFSNPFIDLQFRADNHLKDKVTAIEIKVSETEKGLGPLLSDLIKIRAIGAAQWPFRSVIAVLAYGRDVARRETKFKRLLSDLPGETIEGSGYNFFVIGWEKSQTKNMTHEAYNEWLGKVIGIYKTQGVSRKTARRRD